MSKKRGHAEEHENLERWLVSYADFMTLLFATFVVLYALSQIDIAKFKTLSVSLQQAFAGESVMQGSDGVMQYQGAQGLMTPGQSEDSAPVAPLFDYVKAKQEDMAFESMKKMIEDEKAKGKLGEDKSKDKTSKDKKVDKQGGPGEREEKNEFEGINVQINERGMVISLVDSMLFDSGAAEIKRSAYPALLKIGNVLESKFHDNSIRIEGHTDNIPIKSSIFPSNWELSSARSSSVVRFMLGNFDFKKNQFAALGYADTIPVSPNTTLEGRSKNRRVDIVVLRNRVAKLEPKPNQAPKSAKTPDSSGNKTEQKTGLAKMSSAVIELIKNSKGKPAVVKYQDVYDKESDDLAKELKLREQELRK